MFNKTTFITYRCNFFEKRYKNNNNNKGFYYAKLYNNKIDFK